ncbi:MAG: type IV pilus secretin PilQ [Myxococcales bacterium]|nr:type IV pilus secretin PilQ [Myxococcales bacterium]
MKTESARMTRSTLMFAAALVGLAGQGALAAELNVLSDVAVRPTPAGAQIVLTGSRPPTFTVFRLADPDRLVVDLSTADAGALKGHQDGAGPVAGVVVSQFSDERASVARLLVSLEGASRYDVRADGNRVVVSVDGKKGEPAPVEEAKATPKETDAAEALAVPPPQAENVVASRVDEQAVERPARRVTGLSFSKDTLRVLTDGEMAKFELIELSNPPRLALDLHGVSLSARAPKARSRQVAGVRVGSHGDKVRVVLDVRGEMPAYRASRLERGVSVALNDRPAVQQRAEVSKPAEVEIDGRKVSLESSETEPLVAKAEPAPERPAAMAEVKDLTFADSSEGGRVEIKLAGEVRWKVERPDGRSAVLDLEPARLPKRLERSLDTSALDTPVKMVSVFTAPGSAGKVRVVVAANGALEETLVKTASGLSWRLAAKGVATEQAAVSSKAAGFASESARYAERGAPRRARYTGKKVSFEFKDIDIHNLLRVIAEISKKNIVVADDVQGKVTIRLRNVPWDQALELILRSKGLGKEELGNNIVRVAPLKTLEEESKLREERRKSLQRQEELVVQLIPVNYATADQMSSRVKDVLSERGTVSVDLRTNTLIVRDVASNIGRARALVQRLDTQTPQVLIESRIVEAATNFVKQIGVQWGGHAQAAPATGNPTGLIFPSTFSVRGGSSGDASAGTAGTPNFAVNLPAAVSTGSGGALGFVFGSAGGAVALNLRLSALENQGVVKTISAPRVTTLDNNLARISQGVSIPFSQASAQGVNTTFVEARLSLEVTPHITQDGSVLMNIKAENNQPDPSNTGANGQPAIQRKEANTQVLVKDSDTTVIGGIYVRRAANSTSSVPLLGRIPLLGFFFQRSDETENRQELLIFITPRIVNREATSVAQNL